LIFLGGLSLESFEDLAEIAQVVKAAVEGSFGDAVAEGGHLDAGVFNTQFGDVFDGGLGGVFLKDAAKIFTAEPRALGKGLQLQRLGIVLFQPADELHNVFGLARVGGVIGGEQHFREDTQAIRKKSIHASRLRGLFAGTMRLASSVALSIVLWKGGYIAVEEIGTFSVFMSYAQGMMEPLRWIVDIISDLITTQVNIERFTNLLAVKSDVTDTPEVIEKYGNSFEPKKENWEPILGDIEFRDVTFQYPDGDENVLEHFNLKIPFGSHIAIVGETGAGKSTLVNLVCRFYEPTEGTLLIDGKDARERSQLWLHSAIGYVLQNPHLFSGTVRENLLMGNPNATEQQLLEAIKTVSAEDVIAHLEDGLDTDVGEGGDLLSTGEKQLISFARAILADPRILILDEATASVDTMTEARIQSAMETVIQGRTSLMIAHRLSTVRNADVILVVKDGKIVEQGTHPELLKQKGYYFELYTRQYQEEATANLLS